MATPHSIRVKLISDEAGAVTITPVVVQEMTITELMDLVVGKVGKEADRVARVLRAGTLVIGASRYRWDGWEIEAAELARLLAPYPDADPGRPFDAGRCSLVILRFRSGASVEIEPQELSRRRLLRRQSFWDAVRSLLTSSPPEYEDYSHQEKADRYRLSLDPPALSRLRQAADLLVHGQLAARLRTHDVAAVDFFVTRPCAPG